MQRYEDSFNWQKNVSRVRKKFNQWIVLRQSQAGCTNVVNRLNGRDGGEMYWWNKNGAPRDCRRITEGSI